MSGLRNIAFAGGDERNIYMAEYFSNNGFTVYTYCLRHEKLLKHCQKVYSLEDLLESSRTIVLPIPLIKNGCCLNIDANDNDVNISVLTSLLQSKHIVFGGKFPGSFSSYCADHEIDCHDFLQNESVSIMNAIATAEGTISRAIQLSKINLHLSKCLVLGYGKCGSILAGKLKALSCDVTVCVRSNYQIASSIATGIKAINISNLSKTINEYDFIFNTIPSCILTPCLLDKVKTDAIIIDISSYPGGVDFEYAASCNLTSELYLGIPGKVAPKSSAEFLCKEIMQIIS